MIAVAGGPGAVWGERGRSDGRWAAVSLSEFDRRLLEVVCGHRVVTQGQLERLFPKVPERTLRYRTRRLHALGLVGRSRPYRERGSAPWHLWPTRRADALVRGDPPPRGGERPQPGPVFVAHAAALTELYVSLVTRPPAGVVLEKNARERQAREEFRDRAGRERAIAPDATISLRDGDGRLLVAFVEVDLGTMSRTRLRTKARGYADYVEREAWRERHGWCPALLFITTGQVRADAFCELLAHALPAPSRYAADEWFVGAASAQVTDLPAALTGRGWRDLPGDKNLTLLDCLEEARRGYDERQAARRAQRDADDHERQRLRSNPTAMREHLRAQAMPGYALEKRFGNTEARALMILLASTHPTSEAERTVLCALAGDDPLAARLLDRPMEEALRGALAALVESYRDAQQHRLDDLAAAHGEGPHLRAGRERLAAGELLSDLALDDLARQAHADADAREHQAQLRTAYEQRRESEARRLARSRGLSTRLLRGTEPFLEEADRLWLRICPNCQEIAYPNRDEQPDPDGQPREGRACAFCGTRALEAWTPEWARDECEETA